MQLTTIRFLMPADRHVRKILIANRGEIALRVMRAAHSLGIEVAAVYADSESKSHWVGRFRESHSLGHGNVAATYLNGELIIRKAKEAGADAIHPGYGFLSENPRFARLCEQNSLIFIGPPADVMEKLGDKLIAGDLARELGIPVLPKFTGAPEDLLREAGRFDYPLLVKAASGGGGRGMRKINNPDELKSALEPAAREAKQYFGDERIYVEKYLDAPRHVEVQIMADHHGNVVHLFERECSIQRRHQKVIEEAPAGGFPADLLASVREAALTLARTAGYVNAGTFEFLVTDQEKFYFLEANPRIQVEHGVTEMVTGLDLVREQILVAAGHPLSFSQQDVHCSGHAIEARIYAEDPWGDQLPSPGHIRSFSIPDADGLRIESALVSGSAVEPDYDPLVAKLILHAADRPEAVRQLYSALGNSVITGILHNIPLLRSILTDPDFMHYRIDTTFLKHRSAGMESMYYLQRREFPQEAVVAAATLLILQQVPVLAGTPVYFRNVPWLEFYIDDKETRVFYRFSGKPQAEIIHGNELSVLTDLAISGDAICFSLGGQRYAFHHAPDQETAFNLTSLGFTFRINRPDLASVFRNMLKEPGEEDQSGFIRAPLPGRVSRIHARQNDRVEKGDSLLTIESMKLENAILASMSGVVDRIFTQEGSQVNIHDPLLVLKTVESLTN